MSSEALRLAGELPSIDNLKRIAASNSPTAIQNALDNAIKWIQSLERELKFERAASFRDQIASLEAERDQLRAEVERLREFFDADMAVAKIYDEVSPGLTSPKGAEWSGRVEAAIARRCAAVIAIEAAKEAK